jgi:hypothetical protein
LEAFLGKSLEPNYNIIKSVTICELVRKIRETDRFID